MARRDRELVLKVVADTKTIKTDVASVNKSIGGLEKSAQSIDKTVGGLGKTAKAVGAGFVAAFAVDTVIDFAKGAIGAASDLAEATSKVTVVFEDGAREIESWAKTASTSMGLSETAALSAAGTFGNLFDAMGLTQDASVDMSKGIVQLAADLGSFNNVATEDALQALQSGLLGEAEPMRRFGSALSAARVETYALSRGWVKNKKDLTEAQKVQARYELILEDTVNAQGDFARTADGMANSSKTASARMQELNTEIGKMIIPLGDGLVKAAVTAIDLLYDLGDAFHELEKTLFPGSITEQNEALFAQAKALNLDAYAVVDFANAQRARAKATEEATKATEDQNAADKLNHDLAEFHEQRWRAIEGVASDAALSLDQAAKSSEYVAQAMRMQGLVMDATGTRWVKLGEDIGVTGEALDDNQRIIDDYVKAEGKALLASTFTWGWWNESVKDAASDIPATTHKMVERVSVEIGSLKGVWTQAVKDAEDFDREWRSAIANPARGEKTANEIRDQMKTAMRRRNRALREGNREAFAVADAEVKRLQKKLNSLEQRKYQIDIQMRILGYRQARTKIRGITHSTLLEITDDRPPQHAMGLDRVPYDNYGALLHRGERVLTAKAADRMDAGGGTVNLNVSVAAPIAADGARVGADIIRYLDQAFARGHRLRYRSI